MEDSVLVSFAILTVEWEQRNRSYVDNFVPFVAHCLSIQTTDVVSASEMRRALASEFGLRLPLNAVRTILDRCRKVGLVERDSGVFRRNPTALAKVDVKGSRERAIREHEGLLRGFITFARDQLGQELERDVAEAMLLEYLQRRSLPVMRHMLQARPMSLPTETANGDYLVGRFITWVCNGEPDLFKYLETVVKGSMLATVLYLPEPGNFGGPVRDLRVLLDTPFLLGALGLHGDVRKEANLELLAALRRLGARLECLTITLTEIRGVLDACARTLRRPRAKLRVPESVLDHAVEVGLTATDLEVMSERLEDDLRATGVRVVDLPIVSADNPVDEELLEARLLDELSYHKHAAAHDAMCLAAAFRLRGGHEKRRFEEAKAIFVTTNSSVVRVSRAFFSEGKPRGDSVPVAALDHEVGMVTWLKSPQRMPDFPANRVLADAYAALNPPEAMWEEYLAAIDHLVESNAISDSDYVVLRYSLEAKRALMQTTKGRTDAFSLGTVDQVLETARRSAASELSQELEVARAQAAEERRARSDAERAEHVARSDAERVERQSRSSERQRHREQEMKIEAVAERVSAFIARAMFFALAALAIAAIVAGVLVETTRSKVLYFALGVVVVLGIVLSLRNLIWGDSVASLSARSETRISDRLKVILLTMFGPSDPTPPGGESREEPNVSDGS